MFVMALNAFGQRFRWNLWKTEKVKDVITNDGFNNDIVSSDLVARSMEIILARPTGFPPITNRHTRWVSSSLGIERPSLPDDPQAIIVLIESV